MIQLLKYVSKPPKITDDKKTAWKYPSQACKILKSNLSEIPANLLEPHDSASKESPSILQWYLKSVLSDAESSSNPIIAGYLTEIVQNALNSEHRDEILQQVLDMKMMEEIYRAAAANDTILNLLLQLVAFKDLSDHFACFSDDEVDLDDPLVQLKNKIYEFAFDRLVVGKNPEREVIKQMLSSLSNEMLTQSKPNTNHWRACQSAILHLFEQDIFQFLLNAMTSPIEPANQLDAKETKFTCAEILKVILHLFLSPPVSEENDDLKNDCLAPSTNMKRPAFVIDDFSSPEDAWLVSFFQVELFPKMEVFLKTLKLEKTLVPFQMEAYALESYQFSFIECCLLASAIPDQCIEVQVRSHHLFEYFFVGFIS